MKGTSVKSLKERKFVSIPLTGHWDAFIGQPDRSWNSVIFGAAGSGKSTFALMLAAEMAKYGKVGYFPTEELLSKTLKDRVSRLDMPGKRFQFYPTRNLDQIKRIIQRAKLRFVFIDSEADCGLTAKILQQWKLEFKGRKSFHIVVQGEYKGNTAWDYNSDVSISVSALQAHTRKNRFKDLSYLSLKHHCK